MFMGRPGAGKGTQVELLRKSMAKIDPNHGILHIEPGAEFRKFNEGPSYTAKLGKQLVDAGGLMPAFMPVYIWSTMLVDRFKGTEHIMFDGAPRKLLEGMMIESVFPFYDLEPHLIYLDVDHPESKKRLLLRGKTSGRKDDNEAAIERRKVAYENDVHPTVEYFKKSAIVKFHNIDGMGTIEEVHERILKSLDLQN
jgi:adenylate kinase